VLEFHLLDAALGLILDVEPDYEFVSLAVTLTGLGIDVAALGTAPHDLPLELTWSRAPDGIPAELKTSNLHYSAPAD
jgi:hypothetical protein